MSKLVLCENKLLFDQKIKSKLYHKIGEGSEGICYSYKDNAYKIIYDKDLIQKITGFLDYMINPERIITSEDIKLSSFAFPEEVYATKNWLLGYKTKLVKNNLFGMQQFFSIEDIAKIDFNKLSFAYKKMLEDIDILSFEKIKIYDLSFNLLFDGEKLTGIDTCGYTKTNEEIKNYNRKCLAYAIEDLFCVNSENIINYSIKNDDIDIYLEKVDKQLRKMNIK